MNEYAVIKLEILSFLQVNGPVKGIELAWALDGPAYSVDEVWCTALDMARQQIISQALVNDYLVFSCKEEAC